MNLRCYNLCIQFSDNMVYINKGAHLAYVSIARSGVSVRMSEVACFLRAAICGWVVVCKP